MNTHWLDGCGCGECAAGHPDDITPAPLDPAKVKTGDTVTLTRGQAVVIDEVRAVRHPHTEWFAFELSQDQKGESARAVKAGPRIVLDAWTLTDHQPAPAPEPEWEDGSMAAVTARGWINGWSVRVPGGWASHSETDDVRTDDEVESVRPLVVIDPATVDVVALDRVMDAAESYYPEYTTEGRHAGIKALLAHLGIEAP